MDFDPNKYVEEDEQEFDPNSYTADFDPAAYASSEETPEPITDVGETALRAGAQGISLGTIDEITAGVGAAYDYAFDNPYGADLGDIYDVKHARISGADKKAQEDRPVMYNTVEFAAGMATPAGALGKLKHVKDLGRVKKAATVGAGTGAIAGLGYGDKGEKLESAAMGAGIGGTLGGLSAKYGVKVARGIAKRLGVSDDAIERYLADPDKIKNTKFDEVQETFEAPLKSFQDDFSGTVDELASTKRSLDHAKNRASSSKQALRQEVNDEVFQTGESARKAKQALQQQLDDTPVPHDVTDDVAAGLTTQRDMTSQLAKKQIDYLQEQKHKVDLSDLDVVFKGALKREMIAGVDPNTENVQRIKQMQGLISKIRRRHLNKEVSRLKNQLIEEGADVDPAIKRLIEEDRVMELIPKEQAEALLKKGDKVAPEAFMKIRQTIADQIEAYGQNQGGYTKRSDRLGQKLYGEINTILDKAPGGPGYKAIRSNLARETQAANELSESFGTRDPDKLVKTLRSLADPTNKAKMELLKKLDARSGGKIMPKLRPYFEAQAKKRNTPELQKLLDTLPESQAHAAAQARRRGLPQALDSLPEVQESKFLDNRSALLSQKQKALKEAAGDYRNLGMGAQGVDSQNAIRKLMFRNDATRPETKLVAATKRLGGDDLLSTADDLKAAAEFAASGPQGSRLATAGGNIGAALGSPLGTIGRTVGRGIGSWAGMGVDYSRGRAARAALDAAMSEKMPIAKGLTLIIGQNIDKLVEVAQVNPQAEKYLTALDAAGEKGPAAVISTHHILMKDPAYKGMVEGDER